ncbi:MAG TPA: hypothetical protein VGA37_02835 [Gemmatimonadales bacterium]
MIPARERANWRFLMGSLLVHALILFVAIWDWSGVPPLEESLAPGGEGPRGGGGGGGGPRITYVALPAYQPPPQARPTERSQQRPEDIVIPTPTITEVKLEEPEFQIPRETAPLPGSEVLGQGAGTGGGTGAGTGSGGGIGSGRGTGIGSGVGPGTGGDGGDVFSPAPRYTVMPPQPRPPSVKGKSFALLFTVGADGRVIRVEIEPNIRDTDYRRRLIAQLYEWTFTPAVTIEGKPVAAPFRVDITL